MDMDPFDEFEMKPLTDGLGFHKKAVKFKKDSIERPTKRSGSLLDIQQAPSEEEDSGLRSSIEAKTDALDDLLATLGQLDRKAVDVTEPLPRPHAKKAMGPEIRFEPEMPVPPKPTSDPVTPHVDVPKIEKNQKAPPSTKFRIESSVGVRRSAGDSPGGGLRPTPVSLSSILLDAIFVLALSMIFLVSLLIATKVDLTSVLRNLQVDMATQVAIGILYVSVYQMYVIISRSFFGKSLGEWTFDVQLGSDRQISSALYPFRVMWRSFVILVTGIVTLPLFSLIIRKDLAKYLTGLQLYKRD